MTCAVCGTTNEAGARFCYRCGSALPADNAPASAADRNTPAFGSPVVTEDATSARVYDVPLSAPMQSYQATDARSADYNYPGTQTQYAPYGTALPQQSNTALIAMIMGILSFVVIPVVGAIVAIVLGRNARREIRQSGGRLSGDGMALAGIVLGWINLALVIIPSCLVVVFILAAGATAP